MEPYSDRNVGVFTLRKSREQSLLNKQICLQPPSASTALNLRHNNILPLDSEIPKLSPEPSRAGVILHGAATELEL